VKIISGIVALGMVTALSAVDFRMISSVVLPDSAYLDASKAIGFELGTTSTYRENGLNYGFRAGLMATDSKFQNGSSASMNVEVIYRKSRTYEPYITGGATYQSLNGEDFGYGYNYGAGMRYVWCNGWLFGLEFNAQELQFKSGQSATIAAQGESYTNHNIILTVGYRIY